MTPPATHLLPRRTAAASSGLGRLRPGRRPCLAALPSRHRPDHRLLSAAAKAESQPEPPTDWNQFISRNPQPPDASPPRRFTLAVKDNIATLGTDAPTTCASGMLAGYASPFEATVVAQLRARGAAVVGKTNLDEFGMGSHSLFSHWGRVAAPAAAPDSTDTDASLSVGGSSGGAAVAVRLGDADVALGTDTGGSVRLPAAYGGVVGFKPSYGMLSRFGVVPYANSLDTVGLLAGDVAPIRRLIVGDGDGGENGGGLWREADSDHDPTALTRQTRQRLAAQREGYGGTQQPTTTTTTTTTAPTPHPLRGLVVGIPLEYNIAELDPRIRAAWAAAAARLQALGARVAAVSLPSTRHALAAYYVLAPAEAASNLARYDGVRYGGVDGTALSNGAVDDDDPAVLYEAERGAGLGREVQRRILLGAYALSSAGRDNYFLQAQRVRRLVVRDFDAVFRLANPLRDGDDSDGEHTPSTSSSSSDIGFDSGQQQQQHIDLCDLPADVPLADKRGPALVDFLLCPTAPTPAPRLADVVAAPSPVDAYVNDVFTVPASLAGLPAISIPTPMGSGGQDQPAAGTTTTTGCPGLQLIGQFWDDARLLTVAETVMSDAFRRPEDQAALLRHRRTGVADP